jgi:hypothetical protein
MDIKNTIIDTNLFSIFIFILIVSANFLAEIFPCRLQDVLRNNMLVKHIFGFFTMIFFVVLSSNSKDKDIFFIVKNSFMLYILFILISKCHVSLFYIILIFLGMSYIINILKQQEDEKIKDIDKKESSDKLINYNNKINIFNNITFVLYILTFLVIIIGVLAYMGEKKVEYKNNFSYFTFFIGKPKCLHKSPHVNFIKSLKQAFLPIPKIEKK